MLLPLAPVWPDAVAAATTIEVSIESPLAWQHPTAAKPRRPTREDVLDYRGWLTGQHDADGRVIWTPALPGASAELRREWLSRLSAAGATHVPVGSFEGGETYPGVGWDNPDWRAQPAAIRAFLLEILETPTTRGHGMVPVIFLSGDSHEPPSYLSQMMASVSEAIADLSASVITVPCGWEPEWLAETCVDAIERWRPMAHGAAIAWHGPQGWLGPRMPLDEFWPLVDMALFQSPAVRTHEEVACAIGSRACWATPTRAAIARIGTGICVDDVEGEEAPCGPAKRPAFVWFEGTAYHEFRGQAEPGVSVAMANRVRGWCRDYDVDCGYGQALPAEP